MEPSTPSFSKTWTWVGAAPSIPSWSPVWQLTVAIDPEYGAVSNGGAIERQSDPAAVPAVRGYVPTSQTWSVRARLTSAGPTSIAYSYPVGSYSELVAPPGWLPPRQDS